ncbi:MAG: acylphosphatase [Candidatus Chromulinivorax sp.]
MKKCIKVIFEVVDAQKVLENFIAKQADKHKVEGIGQKIQDGIVQLYVCAQEEQVEEFIDSLYLGTAHIKLENIVIETCPTDRTYRGVFRIVE